MEQVGSLGDVEIMLDQFTTSNHINFQLDSVFEIGMPSRKISRKNRHRFQLQLYNFAHSTRLTDEFIAFFLPLLF
jgi:hypothetical protein